MAKPISTIHKKFGERIRELRKKQHMSQEELAFKIGIDRSYMGFVERGERNPTLDKIVKIAKVLNKTLSQLLDAI